MFLTFPEDARWDEDRQAVEFGIEIGEYRGVGRVPRGVFLRLLSDRPIPERCLEANYLQRTRFERIAERKLRRRQLTEDGKLEITGRDLREGASVTFDAGLMMFVRGDDAAWRSLRLTGRRGGHERPSRRKAATLPPAGGQIASHCTGSAFSCRQEGLDGGRQTFRAEGHRA